MNGMPFILSRSAKESKSRREILMLLRQKNLSAEKIEWAMEQSYGETGGDQEAILKILQKKRFFENIEESGKSTENLRLSGTKRVPV